MGERGWVCSFCGKHQREVKKLVAGPTSTICDECVGNCVAAMDNRVPGPGMTRGERKVLDAVRAWFEGLVDEGHVGRQHALFAALRDLYDEDDASVDVTPAAAGEEGRS